jgi:hypothetical protein
MEHREALVALRHFLSTQILRQKKHASQGDVTMACAVQSPRSPFKQGH